MIDNDQAVLEGDWIEGSLIHPHVGSSYHHDGNESKGELTATYQAKVKPGSYEVRVSYPVNSNRATNVPIIIHHRGGEATVKVNQQQSPAIDETFQTLGRFEFDETATIIISNRDTDGHTLIDSVQLVPNEP